jgi:DNA-binding HxlR family transcriptional regulator
MGSRSYHQYCGLAAALDVVGERWALLIVRDLEPGPRRFTDLFNELRGIATDILADRLRSLEAAGAVQQTHLKYPTPANVYELTGRGRELAAIASCLARWGAPLLPEAPAEAMRLHPRWALQSMVLAYTGDARNGQYAITIDGDDYTITIADATAHLSYGPPTAQPVLWARCDAAGFFGLATHGLLERVELDVGSPRLLRDFVGSLPLLVGAGAGPSPASGHRTGPPGRRAYQNQPACTPGS